MQFQQIRGATSIVTFGGRRFLIDPFFAPRGSCPPVPSPYNNLANPLVDLPLPVDSLIAVDAVIVTHMHHFDHFDEAAARALPKDLPVFVQSEKEAADMRALGFQQVTPLVAAGVRFASVTLHRTDALHGDGVTAAYYYRKFNLPAEACGVVFRAENHKVFYLAGDTLWFPGSRPSRPTGRRSLPSMRPMPRCTTVPPSSWALTAYGRWPLPPLMPRSLPRIWMRSTMPALIVPACGPLPWPKV